MRKGNNKGFTLAELLIVVAIIAVLVAIAIPVFTSQLEKSREATDAANVRSAYAEVVTHYLSDASVITISVDAKQAQSGWQTNPQPVIVVQGDGKQEDISWSAKTAPSGKYTVTMSVDSKGVATPVIN